MSPTPKFCRKCGGIRVETDKFCRSCGCPYTQPLVEANLEQPAPQKPRQKGGSKRGIALVLAVVMFFTAFVKPGFLRKKKTKDPVWPGDSVTLQNPPDSTTEEEPDPLRLVDEDCIIQVGPYETELACEGILDEDNRTLTDGKVSLTVMEGFIEGSRAGTIRQSTAPVPVDIAGESVPLTILECEVEGIHTDSYLTITIPMEQQEGCSYGAAYIDEDGVMHPIPNRYDAQAQTLTIYTTHLSTYCGFPVENEGTKDAMLAYMYAEETGEALGNYTMEQFVHILEANAEAGNDFCSAMDIADAISQGSFYAGTADSLAGLGSLVSTTGEGGGNTVIMKGTIGTVGEIMNTNWGKSGTMMLYEKNYGAALKQSSITDKLKSNYPSDFIDHAGDIMYLLNTALCAFKIGNYVMRDGWRSQDAAVEISKQLVDQAIFWIGKTAGTAAFSVYAIGISLFGYALDQFANEAKTGREKVYMSAYTRYYQTKGTNGGYRSAAEWVKIFDRLLTEGATDKDVEAAIDSYVNEFWRKADQMDEGYLDSLITKDDRAAWGAAAQAGLTDKLKADISASYRQELLPYISNIMNYVVEKHRTQYLETYQNQLDLFRSQMNQLIRIPIHNYGLRDGEESVYSGCIVRFRGLGNKVSDPKAWETTLNKHGQGVLSFTFLAHLMANAGTELEIVRETENGEEILETHPIYFKTDNYGHYPRLYAVVVLNEPEREEEPTVTEEPYEYDYDEPEVDEDRIPTTFVYYNDTLTEDGSEIPVEDLHTHRGMTAEAFWGTTLVFQGDGTFVLRGNDVHHSGNPTSTEYGVSTVQYDTTLTDAYISGRLEGQHIADFKLRGNYLFDSIIDFADDGVREHGTDRYEGVIEGATEYPTEMDLSRYNYVSYEELDGQMRWVLHLFFYIAPHWTETYYNKKTWLDDGSVDEDGYTTETDGARQKLRITFVGQ